jgi:hypothetical protein
VEYEVPRNLDVPDRIGIPFFTTVQFGILVVGIFVCVLLWKALDPFGTPIPTRIWLVYIPVFAFLLPRSVTGSGWTNYRIITARVGRWCRPRRGIWRPE